MVAVNRRKVFCKNCAFQSMQTEEHFFISIKQAAVCNENISILKNAILRDT
jgi:hypothetical protein